MSARPASLRINKFNVVRQDDPSHPKDVIAAEGHKHKKQFSHEKDSIIIQCSSMEHMLACAIETGIHHRYCSCMEKGVRMDMELPEAI